MSSPAGPDLLATLRDLLGDRVTASAAVRDHHSRGESYHAPAPPDLVAFPLTTDEVAAIVRACADRDVPVIPFGAGTSLEGQVLALSGGVSIDLSRMNQILRVSVEDLDATVEAGVTHRQLSRHLQNTGLTFFVDPGADATLGGMTATGASGTTAVRYGTMRENVRGLTVVLADGRIIKTGGRARKSSAGYDLTRLFVGSEGTLGVITEITLRLQPLPEAVSAAVCGFPTIADAVQTVIATIQLGVPVARIELLDEVQMDAINRHARLAYQPLPTLFFEFHGHSEREVIEHAETVQALAAERTARTSRGSPGPRIGRSCGEPGTTPTSRRWPCGRAQKPGAPMPASRSPASPTALSNQSAISMRRRSPARSSGMPATATFTCSIWSIPIPRRRWPRRRG